MDAPARVQGRVRGRRCTGTCEIENRGNPTIPEHCEIGEIDEDQVKFSVYLGTKT